MIGGAATTENILANTATGIATLQLGNTSGSTKISTTSAGNALTISTGAGPSINYTFDAAGSVGIGVTPTVASLPTLQMGVGLITANTEVDLMQNAYYNGGFKYTAAAAATRYYQGSGAHQWYYAASGAADAAITFTQGLSLTATGNVLINTTGTVTGETLSIKSFGNTSATYATVLSNSSGAIMWYVQDNGFFSTGTAAGSPYNNTTGSAANVYIDSNGILGRSTSSLKYKKDIEDAVHGLSDLLKLRPVTFKSNADGDKIFGGFIAEEVDEIGLTEFVQYDSEDKPDALYYANMVSLCVKAIQELSAQVEELKGKIAAPAATKSKSK